MNKIFIFLTIAVIQLFHSDELNAMKKRSNESRPQASQTSSKKKLWACSECENDPYSTKVRYEVHLLRDHYVCPTCKFSIPDAKDNQEKLKQLAEHIVNDCGKKLFTCVIKIQRKTKSVFLLHY